jgi:hypothetical protein
MQLQPLTRGHATSFLAVYGGDDESDPSLMASYDLGHVHCYMRTDLKAPRDKGWPDKRVSRTGHAAEIESKSAGIILYASGVIDLDCDGPNAEQELAELFAGVEVPAAPSWQSKRGMHYLFKRHPLLDNLPAGTFKYGTDLEIRVGTPTAAQQTVLPHALNGRTWTRPFMPDFGPPPLLDVVAERLLAASKAKPATSEKVKAVVDAWLACCEANEKAVSGVTDKGNLTVIEFPVCPFKSGDQTDGRAALLIDHETGHVGCHCFHAKCKDKGIADFEATLAVPFIGKRAILVRPPEYRVAEQAVRSLAGVENVYQRGGSLVRITAEAPTPPGVKRPPNVPTIEPLSFPLIQQTLSQRADYFKPGKKLTRSNVPGYVVSMVQAQGNWPGVPPLEAVKHCPTLRPDGSILATPGYDPESGLFLTRAMTLPTLTVSEAVAALDYLFVDYPFATPAHKAALIAGLLTPMARHAFDGPAPLFLIDGNTPGVGKSLAVDAISLVVTGEPIAVASAPESDAECRKRITSLAVAGDPLIMLDNIGATLGWPSLDAALTGTKWQDRLLGVSENVSVPLHATWYATGNNVELVGDLPRRTLYVRLASQHEQPELRSDFHERDLRGYVRRERARLVSAALTILAEYQRTGAPDMGLPPWGSYEGWSAVVRSAVVWAGWPDPCETRPALLEQSDTTGELLRTLLTAWREADPHGHGLSVADAWNRRHEVPALAAAFDALPPSRDPRATMGQTLKKLRGRVVGGLTFTAHASGHTNVWRVEG